MTSLNRARLAQVLLLAVLVGGVGYVGDSVVRAHLFARETTVYVDLREAGGLHERSDVTYRGTSVGRVTDIDVTPEGVRAELTLDPGTRIPSDTLAVVANLSAVGEQYLDFRPRAEGSPYLADGDSVAVKDTRLPLPASRLIQDAFRLSQRVDVDDLATLSREVSIALGDEDVNLLQVSQDTNRLFTALEGLQPELLRLLRRGRIPLRTMAAWDSGFTTFARDLKAVTGAVRGSDQELRMLIRRSGPALAELDDLLALTREPLGQLLVSGLVPASIWEKRGPAVQAWLDWAPLQMLAMARSTEGGAGGVTLVPNTGPTCFYAVPQKDATSTTRTAPSLDAQCTTHAPGLQQRGSMYAPRPR